MIGTIINNEWGKDLNEMNPAAALNKQIVVNKAIGSFSAPTAMIVIR